MKYKLTLTEKQAQIVAAACEFYLRIRLGQFGEITFLDMIDQSMDGTEWCNRRDAADAYLFKARGLIYPELGEGRGSSYGVGRFEDADTAYNVYQVLREKFPKDGRKAYPIVGELPLCEVVEEDHVNNGK